MANYSIRPAPRFGFGATLAILSAGGGLFASCAGHPIWGLVLAVVALPLGAIGLMQSSSRRVRGGLVSILAVILGVLGVIVAIVAMVFKAALWPV